MRTHLLSEFQRLKDELDIFKSVCQVAILRQINYELHDDTEGETLFGETRIAGS